MPKQVWPFGQQERKNFQFSSFVALLKSDHISLCTTPNWDSFMVLETRFHILQFIRRHHFENLFTSGTKSSHKTQLPVSFVWTVKTEQPTLPTHCGSLKMNQQEIFIPLESYECLVLMPQTALNFDFCTKSYIRTKNTVPEPLLYVFPDLNLAKIQVLCNQMKRFLEGTLYTQYTTYIHQFHSSPSIKI